MNRRERLMASIRGEPVDRPPVCFYEINGLDELAASEGAGVETDFNIYTHPSWRPVIDLARDQTDRIVMRWVPFRNAPLDPPAELTTVETWIKNGSRFERTTLRAGSRMLTAVTRQDKDVNTVWQVEHLLKNEDDLRIYLELPRPIRGGEPDPRPVLEAEAALGETGIVMIDTADPLCMAAALFHMQDYTVIASQSPELFHALLDRFAEPLYYRTEAIAKTLPGRLWRVVGAEYATYPYMPPRLFRELVTRYDTPLVESIQRHGGFARMHCHGNIKRILADIAATSCTGLDPIEPPPQGDISLRWVRERYGEQMTLFGNLEASDIEMLPTNEFESKVRQALREGTTGTGRGFVLMPSSCPYGRVLPDQARINYEKMVECALSF